jgi:hypothetical protein
MIQRNNPYRRPAPGMEPPKAKEYPRYLKIHVWPNRQERRRESKLLRSRKG